MARKSYMIRYQCASKSLGTVGSYQGSTYQMITPEEVTERFVFSVVFEI
jgi:hypothetical protein